MSPRIAGDGSHYQFQLCRDVSGMMIPTGNGFGLVSVSTFLEVMGKPASAMAWWGFRIGMGGVASALAEQPADLTACQDAEQLEALLKSRGVNPNMKLDSAADRGSGAHEVLEHLAAGNWQLAMDLAGVEANENETTYGLAVIKWWDEQVAPYLENGAITSVTSEQPVWSLAHRYAGTFDLGLEWAGLGWEVLDLKTHKPARGFTKEGQGPAYISDVAQIRAYRMAFEEMGMGQTFKQRVIIARENGKWLDDHREVPAEFIARIREAYDQKQAFEKGEAA